MYELFVIFSLCILGIFLSSLMVIESLTMTMDFTLVYFDAFGIILLSPSILDSLLMSQVSLPMSFSCFFFFQFSHFLINAKRKKYYMIALLLLLAFLLNVTLDAQTKGDYHCL